MEIKMSRPSFHRNVSAVASMMNTEDEFVDVKNMKASPPSAFPSLEQLQYTSLQPISALRSVTGKACYDEVALNDRQTYALDKIAHGENVFITGGSGTGKSEMIKVIVRKLRSMGDKVAVTSANLNGAISIGGQTIQSFCGIKKLDDTWENIKKEVQMNYIQSIWNGIHVLVIDDISMMSPYDFRKILYVAQNARTVKTPIQWVLMGDFLNLPPNGIKPYQEKEKDELEFCFQLPEWAKLIHTTVVLTDDARHATDVEFRSILDNIRMGASNQVKWVARIQERLDCPFDVSQPFTKLYPKYESVNAENEQSLKKLKGMEYKFQAQKGYQIGNEVCPLHVPKSRQHLDKDVLKVVERLSINEYKRTRLLSFLQKHAVVESTLVMKVGAAVILMANLNHKYGLIRGAQGVVTGFVFTPNNVPRYPIVRFDRCECVVKSYMWTVDYSEGTKMWYAQIPLKLGWAFSIHRMRGMTFDRVEINMRDMFDYGQVYDVFSKIKTLKGINFTNINWSSIKAHPLCVEFYDSQHDAWEDGFAKWKKQGKTCEVVQFSAEEHIPKAALHMDKLDNIRGVKRFNALRGPRGDILPDPAPSHPSHRCHDGGGGGEDKCGGGCDDRCGGDKYGDDDKCGGDGGEDKCGHDGGGGDDGEDKCGGDDGGEDESIIVGSKRKKKRKLVDESDDDNDDDNDGRNGDDDSGRNSHDDDDEDEHLPSAGGFMDMESEH